MTDQVTETKTTTIGIMFGMWTRYEVVDAEATDFYSKYDSADYTDEAFPLMTIIWDDIMNEIDSDIFASPKFPASWTEGAAVLEASLAYYEVDGDITACSQLSTKNTALLINGEEWCAEEWDMQEIEQVIDIATGKDIDIYA